MSHRLTTYSWSKGNIFLSCLFFFFNSSFRKGSLFLDAPCLIQVDKQTNRDNNKTNHTHHIYLRLIWVLTSFFSWDVFLCLVHPRLASNSIHHEVKDDIEPLTLLTPWHRTLPFHSVPSIESRAPCIRDNHCSRWAICPSMTMVMS